jgi:hypothetical protein
MLKQIAYGTQEYVQVGERPYVNKRGQTVMLSLWRTNCADCGVEVEIALPSVIKKFEPSRRCRACIDARRAAGKEPSWWRHNKRDVSVLD